MMNTITLPDHISFEELALEWCDLDSNYAIRYISSDCYRFMKYEDADFGDNEVVAEFCPHDRKLSFDHENLVRPILCHIKDRSNAYKIELYRVLNFIKEWSNV